MHVDATAPYLRQLNFQAMNVGHALHVRKLTLEYEATIGMST